jgi:hypothetical protein
VSGGSDSENRDSADGGRVLFRLAARIALPVFGAVLYAGMQQGGDPSVAVLRALAALLAVTGCGWAAERLLTSEPPSRPGEQQRDQG